MNDLGENILDKCRLFLAFVFVLSIAFSTAINNICFCLLLLISLYKFFFDEKKRSKGLNLIGIVSLTVIFYLLLDIFFFGNISEDFKIVEDYVVLLASPLLFLGDKRFVTKFKKAYLWAYVIFLLFAFYGVTNNFITYGQFNFYKFGGGIEDFLPFERLYFGFASIIAGIFVVDFFKKEILKKYLFLSTILIINFLIVSRLAWAILLFIFLSQLLVDSRNKQTLKYGWALVVLVVGMGFLGIINKGFKNRFYLNSDTLDELVLQIKINEPRIAIWGCALSLDTGHQEFNLLTGYATDKQIMDNLIDCYQSDIFTDDKREWFVKVEYNSHSQFLYIYLLHGVIGLVLVGIFFMSLLYERRTIVSFYLILAVILFFSIENVLHRQIGTYLIGICLGIIVYGKKGNQQEID